MSNFNVLTAIAAPLAIDNVDTDQIFPSRFTSKRRADGQFGTYLLYDQRFDETGNVKSDFVLNDARFHEARILVAASNYACGSARPGAIFSHIDFGIRAIIAESFGPVFAEVAYKSGLLTIQLAKQDTAYLRDVLSEKPGSQLTIDLTEQVVVAPDGRRFAFQIDPFTKRIFVQGGSEIDLTLSMKDQIVAFEARRRKVVPWAYDLAGRDLQSKS